MRVALGVALVLTVTSLGVAAERPQPPETFAPVVDAVKAAVLSVVPAHDPDADELDADTIMGGFVDALTRLPNRTLGVAVLVDPSGVALTGARVVRGVTDVAVVNIQGRRARATLIGRDERTDIALLRVDGTGPFPVVPFGDSDEVRVGDWVLTVGSPYGFEASVSAGIVSARARTGAGGPWGELLQTDASINPGNAGGPVVNARGELIGLATVSTPRASGIGFAVPSNVVRKVFDDVLAHGRVVRGWLGVGSQPMTAELARGFLAPFSDGLLLSDVVPGGPAARAGLTRGTIVLDIDGLTLRTPEDLDTALAATSPGRSVALHVWSDGHEGTVQVVLAQEPSSTSPSGTRRWHGLVLEGITPEVGVVVTAVDDGSPALAAGVLRGDVVRELDRHAIRNLADFDEASEQVPSGRAFTLLVQRGHHPVYLVLTP